MSPPRNAGPAQWARTVGRDPREPSQSSTRGGAMASPMTDRSLAPYAPADDVRTAGLRPGAPPAELLPEHVARTVEEIAGASGAWCPALSPEGDRVAYVTDRSGTPRLEVAPLDGSTVPVLVSAPDQEVVSVAWSPDGGLLAY